MDQASINRRQRQFEDKGKAEQLLPPEIIADSYPRVVSPYRIKVVNLSGSNLYAYRFIKIDEYDKDNNVYKVEAPDTEEGGLARLGAGQLAIIKRAFRTKNRVWHILAAHTRC